MTRFTGAANSTASDQPHVYLATLIEITFDGGTLYLMDAPGQLEWNSQTWLGVGSLGTISAIEESTDDRPKGLKLTLSGIDSSVITAARSEDHYGRSVIMRSAWFNEDGSLAADPETEWEGRISDMTITTGAESSTVELNCESRLIIWNQANGSQFTDEDQQHLFSGDLFFNQMAIQADQPVIWGKFNASPVTAPSPVPNNVRTTER